MRIRLLAALLAFASVPAAAQAGSIRTYGDAAQLRNFALAQCVARAYDDADVRKDALAVSGAYVEFGSVSDVDAYAEVAALAETWLAKQYQSKHGHPLHLMKCIDYFHSAELDRLVKRYTGSLPR